MAVERGIAPEILLGHIDNTAPWIKAGAAPATPYHEVVARAFSGGLGGSHLDYYELCLCAHYSTVATFVPTDVDNQIRKNLWLGAPLEVSRKMAGLVLESLKWDFRPVTARLQVSVDGSTYVCGHQGEWFTVAAGAYAAHRESDPELAKEILGRVVGELRAEAALYAGLRRAKDGAGCLKACTAIAHNLGDLDRVIDQWELPEGDALRMAVYKLGHEGSKAAGLPAAEKALLIEAGNLNKAFMASENHRHYPLRKPRGLRRGLELLLPTGPFFDSWGEAVGRSRLLEDRDRIEIAEALLEGFQKLSSPKVPLYGYARALAGLQRSSRVLAELASSKRKLLERGPIAEHMRGDARGFEASWGKKALAFLKL